MDIKIIDASDCCVCKLSELAQKGLEQVLLSAILGRVFVVGENDYYLGAFLVDNCDTFNNIDDLKHIPVVTSETNLNDPSIEKRARIFFSEKDNQHTILPIVNTRNVFIGGVFCVENYGYAEKIASLARIGYYRDKNITLENFLISGNYHRIAIWGLDETSLAFANEARHFKNIDLLGIYENKKRQKYIMIDYINYEVDVNFVNSVADVINLDVDLIIVSDWTMRDIQKLFILKAKVDIKYITDILLKTFSTGFENSSYVNTTIEKEFQNSVRSLGIEMLMVRVPIEADMGLPRKGPNFNTAGRLNWLERQGGWEHDSPEMMEFNKARVDVMSNLIKEDGLVYYADFRSDNLNFINKKRVVLNEPKEYDNTVYLVGPCLVVSQYVSDKNAFGYCFQEKLLERRMKYRVAALGMPNNTDRYYWIELVKRQNFKPGDKIFLFDQTPRMSEWDIDLLDTFNQLFETYGDDFYYDTPIHCGKEANDAISDFLCDYMEQHCVSSNSLPIQSFTPPGEVKTQSFSGNPQLKKYQEFIQSNAIHKMPRIGSIVMNCNPFTLGHRYLIEYAAGQVDYLYIFVVEEDKSYFKFEDRIELIKAGTNHLKNVKVLPSGQFIISTTTFSEYFDKANLKGTTIDTSLDVETFGSQIAPCLNISVRFVGEEPLDPITAQYNQSMKEILPKYGIELCEIPRKETDGGVISASRVRKCLEEKKWDEIRKLVPETTYLFLEEKFK